MCSSKRVLLIQAYQGRFDPRGPVFPLGLCYIATVLSQKGHDVQIYDPNTVEHPYRNLEKILLEFQPDVVGLGIRNIDSLDKRDIFYHYKTVQPTLQLIKKAVPKSMIIAGGSGFSMFAEKIMQRNPEIDIGVYLEGEESIAELMDYFDTPELVKGLFISRGEKVFFTGERPLPDINTLPIPHRDYLDLSHYTFPICNMGIQTKRGCLLTCAYCSYPFLNGRRVRLRSPDKVVDEIAYLANDCGIREFMFVDGVFNIPEEHARKICKLIIKRNMDVRWAAWCHLKGITDDFISLAKEAGMRRMTLSPDAVTDQALKALKKGICKKDIDKGVKLLQKHIDLHISFGFFGISPGQTFMGVLQTIYYYFRINLSFVRRGGGVSISWIRIEPHTGVEIIALEEGFIHKDTDLLPEKEKDLYKLFYTIPRLRLMEYFVTFVLKGVRRFIIPVIGLLKHS